MGKLLKKEDLTRFLYKLKQNSELIAPVENGKKFEKIENIKKISLEKITRFSPKKFFMPEKEKILSYQEQKINVIKNSEKRIIFGIRKCDINALLKMDKLFLDPKNPDIQYKKRRENTLLIGYHCTEPEENCFCESMQLEDYHDLFFYEMGDYYYIDVGSDKGLKLVSRLKDYDYNPPKIKCKKSLDKKLSKKFFNDVIWDKLAKECISCGKCTLVCPTCFCFDMNDKTDLGLLDGYRFREWDSCQYQDFTKVSGGMIFRDTRGERLKHRIYHKLVYFRERFSKDMCVGCGRCITNCPAGIDFVKTVNKLK